MNNDKMNNLNNLSCRLAWLPLVLFCVININIYAQTEKSKKQTKALIVGETVPDFVLPNLLNYGKKNATISDFNGKLIILDFWSTWCGACIALFPEYEKLQKEFQGDLVIMPISFFHKKPEVEKFLAGLKKEGREMKLPTAVYEEDKNIMLSSFPNVGGFPHEVWIGRDGKLLAVTDQYPVTAKNIDSYLKTGMLNVKNKLTIQYDKDHKTNDSQISNTPVSLRTAIWPFTPKMESAFSFTDDSTQTRIFIANSRILDLYTMAFARANKGEFGSYGTDFKKRILYELPKSSSQSKLLHLPRRSISNSEFSNDLFCYESVMPVGFTLNSGFKEMIRNLNFYFHMNGHLETRDTNCLSLIRNNTNNRFLVYDINSKVNDTLVVRDSFSSGHGLNNDLLFVATDSSLIAKNIESETLISWLNNEKFELPYIVDDTALNGKRISVVIKIQEMNLEEIRKELAKYDLDLVPVKRPIKFIVFSEDKDNL